MLPVPGMLVVRPVIYVIPEFFVVFVVGWAVLAVCPVIVIWV